MRTSIIEVDHAGVHDCVVLEDRGIDEMGFSVRTRNCLVKRGITTLKDLAGLSAKELMSIRNFGEGCLREVESKLGPLGLGLQLD